MEIYKQIYQFEVVDKISSGKQVYVLDRHNKSVALLNEMDMKSAVKIVNAENKDRRYDYWICEEREENKDE